MPLAQLISEIWIPVAIASLMVPIANLIQRNLSERCRQRTSVLMLLVVLMGIAMITLGRPSFQEKRAIWEPFRVLHDAFDFQNGFTWKQRDAWHGMILNILLFCPWGISISLHCQAFSASRKQRFVSYFSGVVLSLIIELIQYFAKVGTLEVDDLLCNSLGGMIGNMLFSMSTRIKK